MVIGRLEDVTTSDWYRDGVVMQGWDAWRYVNRASAWYEC